MASGSLEGCMRSNGDIPAPMLAMSLSLPEPSTTTGASTSASKRSTVPPAACPPCCVSGGPKPLLMGSTVNSSYSIATAAQQGHLPPPAEMLSTPLFFPPPQAWPLPAPAPVPTTQQPFIVPRTGKAEHDAISKICPDLKRAGSLDDLEVSLHYFHQQLLEATPSQARHMAHWAASRRSQAAPSTQQVPAAAARKQGWMGGLHSAWNAVFGTRDMYASIERLDLRPSKYRGLPV